MDVMNIENILKLFDSFLLYFTQYEIMLIVTFFLLAMAVYYIISKLLLKKRILDKTFINIIKYLIILIFLYLLKNQDSIPTTIFKILQTFEIITFGYIAYLTTVEYYIRTRLIKNKNISVNHIIIDLIKLIILIVLVLIFLRTVLNVNLVTILTPSAILTVIIGLAMQDTIGNFVAGLILQIEKPYEVGDWIEVDGLIGMVTEINWRYTKVKTFNMQYIIIPNSDLAKQKVINFTKPTKEYTMIIPIGVSYDHSPLKVKRAVEDVVNSNINTELVGVHLREYGDSSINYDIIFRLKDFALYRKVRNELNSAIWYKFKEKGIEIPFPIRTVIIKDKKDQNIDNELVTVLRKFKIFQNIDSTTLKMLEDFGVKKRYNSGEVIFKEGDTADSMFFVLEGELSVIKNNKELATIYSGDFFGEIGLLTKNNRNTTISAKTSSSIFEIDRGAFKVVLEKETDIVGAVEAIINERKSKEHLITEVDKVSAESRESLFKKFKDIFGVSKT